jgi:tetratricopeptide (TPR) repeat protein
LLSNYAHQLGAENCPTQFSKMNEFQALHCLDQALAAAWMHKGWVHIAQKQATDAQACFNQAAQMDPKFARTWQADACLSLGALFYNSHQVEAAIGPYQQALASSKDQVLALQQRGCFL